MVALTERRFTKRRTGDLNSDPVKANVKIYQGALVCLEAGLSVPGRTAVGLIARGVATALADNTGGVDSAINAESDTGIFAFVNDGTVNRTHINADAWIVDDQTVAAGNGGGTRSKAGTIKDVNAEGVFVQII